VKKNHYEIAKIRGEKMEIRAEEEVGGTV